MQRDLWIPQTSTSGSRLRNDSKANTGYVLGKREVDSEGGARAWRTEPKATATHSQVVGTEPQTGNW